MQYDFNTNSESLKIPTEAFQPIKRCTYCQSVYITDKICEACGSSMHYHPIGVPFGAKSVYGIKERYIERFDVLNRFYPLFENKKSSEAKSYIRNLEKRFSDLISAFNTPGVLLTEERKHFYIESRLLIDELIRFGVNPDLMKMLVEENDNSLIGQELLYYLKDSLELIQVDRPWYALFLNHQLWGVIRVEFFLKVLLTTTTILIVAVGFKDIISSQFGK